MLISAVDIAYPRATRGGSRGVGGGGGGEGNVPPPPPSPFSDGSLNIHECILRTACDYNCTKHAVQRLATALIHVLTGADLHVGRGGGGGALEARDPHSGRLIKYS